jgi:hypothetical protein
LSAWIKPSAIDGIRTIVGRSYTIVPARDLALRINNGKYEITSTFGVTRGTSASIPAEDLNNWVHLAGLYDGSVWKLYRNGILVSTSAVTTVGAVANQADWRIGSSDVPDRYFAGTIDQVQIYGEALTSFQVAAAMEVSVPGDFNGDSTVNAADYTVWRDNLGLQMGALSSNGDADGDGDVDIDDYREWKEHFGESLPFAGLVDFVGTASAIDAALTAEPDESHSRAIADPHGVTAILLAGLGSPMAAGRNITQFASHPTLAASANFHLPAYDAALACLQLPGAGRCSDQPQRRVGRLLQHSGQSSEPLATQLDVADFELLPAHCIRKLDLSPFDAN